MQAAAQAGACGLLCESGVSGRLGATGGARVGVVLTSRVQQRQRFRQRERLEERPAVGGAVEGCIYRVTVDKKVSGPQAPGPSCSARSTNI